MSTATISSPTRVAVSARGLTRVYGTGAAAVTALRDVHVDIAAGRMTAIVGAGGSGKSTLMRCLAGLDSPDAGSVVLGDLELTRMTDTDLTLVRRDRIGFVFRSFNLLPMLTVEANITLPVRLSGRPIDQEWFDHVTGVLGLRDRLDHRPGELSGVQQQRVAMARALLGRPDVIFADEPTGALDREAGTELLEFLRHSVRSLGQTVVMVTNNPTNASFADAVLTMCDGRILAPTLPARV